jgi:hypothetical protein
MAFRCSEPIAADAWTHVATSFGVNGFRLWIDGAPQTAATVELDGVQSCTEPHVFGIDGNDNAIVIGGLNRYSPNHAPAPTVDDPLTGEIDQVRIRSGWRDFTR